MVVFGIISTAKSSFSGEKSPSLREREFPHTQQHTCAREREKETDRQTTIEKTKSEENDGGVVSRAFVVFLKIEV
jgi:hypothetical protein